MSSSLPRIIIVLIVCSVALASYGAWYSVLSGKSATVADLQNKIDTKTETVNRLAATRATLASIANDEATVQNYFVQEIGVVGFIDSLEARGRARGASMRVLSVSTGGTAAQPALVLTLSAKGTFDAVMRTVGSIEYAPYDLSISTLSVGWDAKDSWHADLTLLVGSVPATRSATSTPSVSQTVSALAASSYAYF